MRGQAEAWFGYAEEDCSAAERLVDSHPTIAAYHAHQAAKKGLKALQIDQEGDYDRTMTSSGCTISSTSRPSSGRCWKT